MSFATMRRTSSDTGHDPGTREPAGGARRSPDRAAARSWQSPRLPAATGDPWVVHRKCEECEEEDDDGKRARRSAEPGGGQPARAPAVVHDAVRAAGGRSIRPCAGTSSRGLGATSAPSASIPAPRRTPPPAL